jgi:aspartate carbamoyltransferase catalytic subunit
VRHAASGAPFLITEHLFANGRNDIHVINAGDGPSEHPSQALLDLYTIRKELGIAGPVQNLRIAMVGDLKYGRTVHSLSKLLSLYHNIHFTLVSPKELGMPGDIIEQLLAAGHTVSETESMEEGLHDNDTVYLTRIQEERFSDQKEADIYRGRFRLNHEIYTRHCKPNTVIMHPLPRDSRAEANELDVVAVARAVDHERGALEQPGFDPPGVQYGLDDLTGRQTRALEPRYGPVGVHLGDELLDGFKFRLFGVLLCGHFKLPLRLRRWLGAGWSRRLTG